MCVANRPWAHAYVEQLLCPQDWFSFWRLNCRLASYHALVTGSKGYGQEDKVRSTAVRIIVAIYIAHCSLLEPIEIMGYRRSGRLPITKVI